MTPWTKIATDFYSNPKVLGAGWPAREVYLYLLFRNRAGGYDGKLPARELNGASTLLGLDAATYQEAVDALVHNELLAVEQNTLNIVGWDEEWRAPQSDAERVRRYRAKKKREKKARNDESRTRSLHGNVHVAVREEKSRVEESREEKSVSTSSHTERRARSKLPTKPDPVAFDVAGELARLIAERLPGTRTAKQVAESASRWWRDIEKLHRIDGQSWERIREVMEWSQRDPFWQANIMSGAKLRKQFDTLQAQMLRPAARTQRNDGTLSPQEIWNLADEWAAAEEEANASE